MKKICFIKRAFLAVFVLISTFSLASCGKNNTLILRVYNWGDYIDDGYGDDESEKGPSVIEDFEKYYEEVTGKKVRIEYSTFDTPETMYNKVKSGSAKYDLLCPSDYMIQKMIREDMLEVFTSNAFDADGNLLQDGSLSNYAKYGSPYFKKLFKEKGWDKYSVGYMWGTLGIVYNDEKISQIEGVDVTSWDVMWDSKLKGVVSTKDSVRDTYFIGVVNEYQEELKQLRDRYDRNEITKPDYQKELNEIVNRHDKDTISKVEKRLEALKKNVRGFEVDSAKSDIINGQIYMNLAWSGDAVYSMQLAEEENVGLSYQIPLEGSNIWFDGWVMPKGANVELAEAFLNYLCRPDIAVRNMNKIGYTSAIGGEEVKTMIDEWYGLKSLSVTRGIEKLLLNDEETIISNNYREDLDFEENIDEYEISVRDEYIYIDDENTGIKADTLTTEIDLTYFFNDDATSERVVFNINNDYIGNQFTAQYPTEEEVNRCGIMEDFGSATEDVIKMWLSVKGNEINWIWITVIVVIIAVFVFVAVYKKVSQKARYRRLKAKKALKQTR